MPRPPAPPPPDWRDFDLLTAGDFHDLAQRRVELKLMRDDIDAEIEALNLQLAVTLATADVGAVAFGNFHIMLSHGWKGGKLSKERLLELGVPVETIEAAISPKTPGDPYVRVTSVESGEEQ